MGLAHLDGLAGRTQEFQFEETTTILEQHVEMGVSEAPWTAMWRVGGPGKGHREGVKRKGFERK